MTRIPPLFQIPLGPGLGAPVGVYWRPSRAFLDELGGYLSGKPVLEIFSGNGYLAAHLAQRGITVKATTRFSGHDAHERGLYHPVEELSAEEAVAAHGGTSSVLLVSWPTVSPAMLRAARLWGPDKPIVYIGEFGDIRNGVLAGCASDEFFDSVRPGKVFRTYQGSHIEVAMECYFQG